VVVVVVKAKGGWGQVDWTQRKYYISWLTLMENGTDVDDEIDRMRIVRCCK
jgi:hypothetical protein